MSGVKRCKTADEFNEFVQNYEGELVVQTVRVNGKIKQYDASEDNLIVAIYRPEWSK